MDVKTMVELTIERLGAQGDGVAPGPVYVPFALPGERVRFDGEALEILAPAPARVTPVCRHFGDCGGCALQHFEAVSYRKWKAGKVSEALAQRRHAAFRSLELQI